MHEHNHAHQSSASISDFFARLFDTDFMARGDCVSWRPEIVWLHVASDTAIMLSYYSIPLALIYFVRRKKDLAFIWMFVMFAAFILACGTTHLMSILAFWTPVYRLDGLIKAITALLSIATAFTLWPLIPKALALPTPTQLIASNRELERQVRDRLHAESQLQLAHAGLEAAVVARTAELAASNAALQSEITERQHAEQHKEFLFAELDHRVKNNLAMVLTLAEESIRTSSNMKQFEDSFIGRVHALVNTHAALAATKWEGVPLEKLVDIIVGAYKLGNAQRVTRSGDRVSLSSKAASALCLALNELATNAAKYGAFSTPAGRVVIDWRIETTDAPYPSLHITWIERDGPSVTPPSQRGFGTQLVADGVAYELAGKVQFEYRPEGVVCSITFPLNPQNTQRGRFEAFTPDTPSPEGPKPC